MRLICMTPENWHWLESGVCSYDYNMALDQALMDLAPNAAGPVLRFYGWKEPAASFGYSQHFSDIECMTPLRPLVRRPTGGGLVPHDADWTYSLAFPPGHGWYELKAEESYHRVHQWVCDAFKKLGVATSLAPEAIIAGPGQCFIGAEKSDLLWRGRKIAGAAQRRTRQGLLIQGSVQPPPLASDRDAWQKAMLAIAQEQWKVSWTRTEPSVELAALTEELRRTKYSQDSFNRQR